jgi:RNA polymerase sigma factor for flagellar operon FliA
MTAEAMWKAYNENPTEEKKEAIILRYLEVVKIVAGRLYTTYRDHVDFDDLVSYGMIGLIDAIDKFDHKKGVKFETYANIRIRGAIIDQIRSLDWVPRSVRSKAKRYERALSELQNQYGVDVPDEALAQRMGIDLDELDEMTAEIATFSVVSLEDRIQSQVHFDLPNENSDIQPEAVALDVDLKKRLVEGIERLAEKERLVISLYYYDEMTYREIAEILSLTESRISQIHSKAIAKLKIRLDQ